MAVLAVGVATILACGEGDENPMAINWDLASSHTIEDIGFDRSDDTDHYSIDAVESARVELPGDLVFEADDVGDIRISRIGDQVDEINIVLEPLTAEDAYERASALAEQAGLDQARLDDWLEQIRSARKADEREASVGQALATDDPEGSAGFHPSVEIQYSFDDDKPWLVFFTMFWDNETWLSARSPRSKPQEGSSQRREADCSAARWTMSCGATLTPAQ